MARGAPNSRRLASVRKPERPSPEAPAAEPPEAPLGAGPGPGLTGGLPTPEPPLTPPGGPSLEGATEIAATESPTGDAERKRWAPNQPAVQLSVLRPSRAASSQLQLAGRCTPAAPASPAAASSARTVSVAGTTSFWSFSVAGAGGTGSGACAITGRVTSGAFSIA